MAGKKLEMVIAGLVAKMRGTLDMDKLRDFVGWTQGDGKIEIVLRQDGEEIKLSDDFEIAVEFEHKEGEKPAKVRKPRKSKAASAPAATPPTAVDNL